MKQFVNLYEPVAGSDEWIGYAYSTRAEADKGQMVGRVACVEVDIAPTYSE